MRFGEQRVFTIEAELNASKVDDDVEQKCLRDQVYWIMEGITLSSGEEDTDALGRAFLVICCQIDHGWFVSRVT